MLSEALGTHLLAGAQAVETFAALHPRAAFCLQGSRPENEVIGAD